MKTSASSSSFSSTVSSATAGSTDSALRRSPRLAEKAASAYAASAPKPTRVRVSISYPVPVRNTFSCRGCIDQLLGLLMILVMAGFGYLLIRDLSTLK